MSEIYGRLIQYEKYDVAGYITNKDFIRLIQKKYILPQGSLLNGRITMEAENYYVQAGDMRWGEDLAQHIRKTRTNVCKQLDNVKSI